MRDREFDYIVKQLGGHFSKDKQYIEIEKANRKYKIKLSTGEVMVSQFHCGNCLVKCKNGNFSRSYRTLCLVSKSKGWSTQKFTTLQLEIIAKLYAIQEGSLTWRFSRPPACYYQIVSLLTFFKTIFCIKKRRTLAREIPYVFKVLLIGDEGVGKTALFEPFTCNNFDLDYMSTIGVQFLIKTVRFGGLSVRLLIWDFAGQSKHASYRHLYYKAANLAIIVYDPKQAKTFENIPNWIKDIRKAVRGNIPIVILKNNLSREEGGKISTENIENLMKKHPSILVHKEVGQNDSNEMEELFKLVSTGLVLMSEQNRERNFYFSKIAKERGDRESLKKLVTLLTLIAGRRVK